MSKDKIKKYIIRLNASGDMMPKPLFVNKSIRPQALKNKDLKRLPVHLMTNKNAWIIGLINVWFQRSNNI